MEIRDSADDGIGHGNTRKTQYVYGKSLGARMFGAVMDRLRGFETSVNTSTFGRVFRLDGSEHVGQSPLCGCQNHPPRLLLLTEHSVVVHTAGPNTKCQLLHRDPRWTDDICDYGVHHRRKCT